MSLQEKITNIPYTFEREFYVEGVTINAYKNGSVITLFDYNDLGRLIIDLEGNIRNQLQRIYDKISDEFKCIAQVERGNNATRKRNLLSESGLYQFILSIDNPRIDYTKERLINTITKWTKEHGKDPSISLTPDRDNIQDLFMEDDDTNQREKIPVYIREMINKHQGENLIVEEVFTFPVFKRHVIMNERDLNYINHIENVIIGNKLIYYVKTGFVVEGLCKLFGLSFDDALEIIINNSVQEYRIGSKEYMKHDDIYSFVIDITKGNILELTHYKGQQSSFLYKELYMAIFNNKDIVKYLLRSELWYDSIDRNYNTEIYDLYLDRYIKSIKRWKDSSFVNDKIKEKLIEELKL